MGKQTFTIGAFTRHGSATYRPIGKMKVRLILGANPG
jgi:hypothetical protein